MYSFSQDRVFTKSVNLADIGKTKKVNLSLDQILENIDKKNVKVASSSAPVVKTAAVESKTVVKVADAVAPVTATEEIVDVQPTVAEKVEAPVVAAKEIELKVAKSLDFRELDASQVTAMWDAYKTDEECIKKVAGKASDPKTYCNLLKVASTYAGQIIKTANEAKNIKKEVKASVTKQNQTKAPQFKSLAKLSKDEMKDFKEYFGKLYPADYVEALLSDYAK